MTTPHDRDPHRPTAGRIARWIAIAVAGLAGLSAMQAWLAMPRNAPGGWVADWSFAVGPWLALLLLCLPAWGALAMLRRSRLPRAIQSVSVPLLAATVVAAHAALVAPLRPGFADLVQHVSGWRLYRASLAEHVVSDALVCALLLVVWHLATARAALRTREAAALRLSAELAESELRALKLQLQPHFLFNALNALAGSIRPDPALAERMAERLSEFLRMALRASGRQEVTLADELAMVGAYLEIHEMRFGERLRVQYRIEADATAALLPPLLLQPLVENAVTHGMGTAGGEMALEAERDGEWLRVRVVDPGTGGGTALVKGEGVGLANCRARLRQMYGDDAILELSRTPSGSCAEMVLPFRAGPAAQARWSAPTLAEA
jgi:LytS/YehU family sensor histidine kinase